MAGSAMYGVVLGAGFFALTRLAPQPVGSLVWWSLVAAQLTWGATITWRRTRLRFAAAAMLIGAGAAAVVAAATLAGYAFPLLPVAWAVPAYGLMAAGPICLSIEARMHPREWLLWNTYMKGKSAWDILLGRHIPDLARANGRSGYGG